MPFSFCSLAIFGQINKIYVFHFSGRFRTRGEIFSGSRRYRKFMRTWGRKTSQYLHRNDFYGQNKKALFHIIPLGISDHNLIGCIRKINSRKYKRKIINTRNYRAYNKEEMLSDLGRVDWDLLYKQDNVNTAWKFISNNLRKIFEKFLRSIHQKFKKE